jgi:hypothetical protein
MWFIERYGTLTNRLPLRVLFDAMERGLSLSPSIV